MAIVPTTDAKCAIIILSIWTAIATFVVLLRLTRKRSGGTFGADDWLLAVALILLYEQVSWGFVFAIAGGEGKNIRNLDDDEARWFYRTYFFAELGYCAQITATRLSVLLSYKRLLWHIRWCSYAIWALIGICVLWFLGAFLSFLLQCRPLRIAYTPHYMGECFDVEHWVMATAASNMIIDWLILFLPIIPLRRVLTRVERIEKVLICASFGLGLISCIASTARMALTYSVTVDEFTKAKFMAAMTTHAEPIIGVISASLPFVTLGHYSKKAYKGLRAFCAKPSDNNSELPDDEQGLALSVAEMGGRPKTKQTKSSSSGRPEVFL